MPAGVPVATVAINGGQNAGLLAIEMISLFDESIKKNLKEFRENLHTQVEIKIISYQLLDLIIIFKINELIFFY
ncbi:MAG: hypothetical protein Ct9H90mP22_8190 [Gammaproteobacteria bacterium]|nr:MAG: hypothetical protein Ct9H90mP22_8190 [Gammaproteobacteria bacterium]